MIKIGITGSLSSGKTTASKILSKNRGPLFSADEVVKKLYQDKNFRLFLNKLSSHVEILLTLFFFKNFTTDFPVSPKP